MNDPITSHSVDDIENNKLVPWMEKFIGEGGGIY